MRSSHPSLPRGETRFTPAGDTKRRGAPAGVRTGAKTRDAASGTGKRQTSQRDTLRRLARTDPARALRVAETRTRPNDPLRRVLLTCEHAWRRDADAVVHDWVWCAPCADKRSVIRVAP